MIMASGCIWSVAPFLGKTPFSLFLIRLFPNLYIQHPALKFPLLKIPTWAISLARLTHNLPFSLNETNQILPFTNTLQRRLVARILTSPAVLSSSPCLSLLELSVHTPPLAHLPPNLREPRVCCILDLLKPCRNALHYFTPTYVIPSMLPQGTPEGSLDSEPQEAGRPLYILDSLHVWA